MHEGSSIFSERPDRGLVLGDARRDVVTRGSAGRRGGCRVVLRWTCSGGTRRRRPARGGSDRHCPKEDGSHARSIRRAPPSVHRSNHKNERKNGPIRAIVGWPNEVVVALPIRGAPGFRARAERASSTWVRARGNARAVGTAQTFRFRFETLRQKARKNWRGVCFLRVHLVSALM